MNLEAIYGSNKNFLLNALPHIGSALTGSVEDLLRDVEYIILAQTPNAEQAAILAASGLPSLNLVKSSLDFVPRLAATNE